jgi:hypothetical protein
MYCREVLPHGVIYSAGGWKYCCKEFFDKGVNEYRIERNFGEWRRMYVVLYECERMNALACTRKYQNTQEVASRDMIILLCLISISNLKAGRFGSFISMDILKPEVLKLDVLNLTFCKPDVLQTWRFENLTFCKHDVLKPEVLKPDVLKNDVLWVYLFVTAKQWGKKTHANKPCCEHHC